MLLVGNDIVDLREAGVTAKSKNIRFVSRVFTEEEQTTISGSAHPDLTLWVLWAAKETAYKIISKIRPVSVFTYKRFQTSMEEFMKPGDGSFHATVQVRYDNERMAVEVSGDAEWIHAVGSESGSRNRAGFFICSDAKKLEPSSCRQEKNAFPEKSFTQEERASIRNVDSVWVRAYLKQDIAERLGIDPLRLQIIRPAKQNKIYPPFLLIDHKRASMDISLSHHGRWAAWAYSVPRHHFEDCRRSLSVPAI